MFGEIKKALKAAKENGIPKQEFENVKKKTYGEVISMLSSVSSVATTMMDAFFHGYSLFDAIEITAGLTYEDAAKVLAEIDEENSCISIIDPV